MEDVSNNLAKTIEEQTEMMGKFDETKQALLSMLSMIEDTPKQVRKCIERQNQLKIEQDKKITQLRKTEQEKKERQTLLTNR